MISNTTVATATVLPVLELHPSEQRWGRVGVPLVRSGLPSEGIAGMSTGWILLDSPEVGLSGSDLQIEVDLSDRTLRVLDGDDPLHETGGLGIGKATWETPVGRTFVAATYEDASVDYLAGTSVLMLSRYSDARDDFRPAGLETSAPSLIALHHYDGERDGAVSNGCIRLDLATSAWLRAHTPIGTPVYVRR